MEMEGVVVELKYLNLISCAWTLVNEIVNWMDLREKVKKMKKIQLEVMVILYFVDVELVEVSDFVKKCYLDEMIGGMIEFV